MMGSYQCTCNDGYKQTSQHTSCEGIIMHLFLERFQPQCVTSIKVFAYLNIFSVQINV